jgi:rhodanese-related sulfurtransferase
VTGVSDFPLHIDVRSVKDLLESGEDFLLLDCREPDEHTRVRIEGAKLIPMKEVSDRLADLEPYRHKRIVVHCHHGGRSLKVTQLLRSQGFPKVQNMMGGIDVWALLIDTSLPRY